MINKKIFALLAITFVIALAPISSAASSNSSTQTVTVTVKPTIAISVTSPVNFGSLDADGSSTIFNTNVVTSTSNIPIDVWTRALNFAPSTTDALTLNNFAFKSGTSSYTAFTNSYQKALSNIAKAPKGGSVNTNLDLQITVPAGTDPATYSTTVYYSAVPTGTPAPTLP